MFNSDYLYIFTNYLFFIKLLLYFIAALMLVSNLDDFFIDIYYVLNRYWRKIFIYRKHPRLMEEDLFQEGEKPFAIMLPAWDEAAVIFPMLENTLRTYRYQNYHIFIGVYPNDPATTAEVTRACALDKRLHMVVGPHPGPTSKADCLNSIYKHISTTDIPFSGYVLHDAEDIVDPLELHLFNHLIARKDMIQIPVLPLKRSWLELTGGHYRDEFAENHAKDLVARETMSGHVPCAGVGCAFSPHALEKLCDEDGPFDRYNLTEDYDMALRLKNLGLKQAFVRFRRTNGKLVATRNLFPNNFRAAVRQKSRWIMGIVFQGWRHRKWPGNFALKYALFRDRKGVFTAQLAMGAYFVVLNMLLVFLIEYFFPGGYRYPPLVRAAEPLTLLLWLNLGFLISRALHRMVFVYAHYGLLSALMSLPRQIWGNVINFAATLRALRIYSWHLLSGKALVWDKTDHVFPDRTALDKEPS